GVRGQLDKGFGYEIVSELAASTGQLRNAFVEYNGLRGGNRLAGPPVIRFGQHKLPFTLETYEDEATSGMVEKSLIADTLAGTHDRDIGFLLLRSADRRPLSYALSVTNGAGVNQSPATSHKLFSGRLQLAATRGIGAGPLHGSIAAIG